MLVVGGLGIGVVLDWDGLYGVRGGEVRLDL